MSQKIAIYHNLTSGGSKREAYEFAREFVRLGHTVHVFSPSTADEDFLPLGGVAHRNIRFDLKLPSETRLRLPGIRKYIDLAILLINLKRLDSFARRVATAIDAEGYDFVLVHHDRVVQSPYLLRHLRTRSAYYCAEPMRKFYEPPVVRSYQQPRTAWECAQRLWYAPARHISRLAVRTEDRRNVREADAVLANSFFSAEAIYRAYALRAQVSYLGVDSELFRPMALERQNFVLSVGAVSPLKGYDFLIDALGFIPTAIRPEFVIVGNTASSGEVRFLKDMAARQGVEVRFCVNVTDQNLVALYNQARALVYAPVLEPFGFAPLEAMACATPVIAVKEGGVRESVVDGVTGLLAPREPIIFAQKLKEVLTDPALAHTLGKNGREIILSLWTWTRAAERLIDQVTKGAGESATHLLH